METNTNPTHTPTIFETFENAAPADATHYYHRRMDCILTREAAMALGVWHDCMLPMVRMPRANKTEKIFSMDF